MVPGTFVSIESAELWKSFVSAMGMKRGLLEVPVIECTKAIAQARDVLHANYTRESIIALT